MAVTGSGRRGDVGWRIWSCVQDRKESEYVRWEPSEGVQENTEGRGERWEEESRRSWVTAISVGGKERRN